MRAPRGIELLRAAVEWANNQDPSHWHPADGRDPTPLQIMRLYSLCMAWDCDKIEQLQNSTVGKARKAYVFWDMNRGL